MERKYWDNNLIRLVDLFFIESDIVQSTNLKQLPKAQSSENILYCQIEKAVLV